MFGLLHPALGRTLYMVGAGTLFGIPLGVLPHVTAPGGLRPVPVLHRILGTGVDFGRSLPSTATPRDIADNPKHLQFVKSAAAQPGRHGCLDRDR